MKFENKKLPTISIGLPVYNGEESILNALNSLLKQTFSNFELIISDNASTDLTGEICKSKMITDKRIRYFRQEKNMNQLWNFNFVLKQAVGEFFMWAGADDVWHPKFLEKNIENLTLNQNIVGSISEIEFYYNKWEENDLKKFENTKVREKNKLVHSIIGEYSEKVDFVFDFNHPQCVYSVFRRNVLVESTIRKPFGSWDYAVILKVLQYGDISVIDELLMYMYRGHKTEENRKKLFYSCRQQKISIVKSLFPFMPLTFWCLNNIGLRNFMNNFSRFVKMNFRAERLILKEFFKDD